MKERVRKEEDDEKSCDEKRKDDEGKKVWGRWVGHAGSYGRCGNGFLLALIAPEIRLTLDERSEKEVATQEERNNNYQSSTIHGFGRKVFL